MATERTSAEAAFRKYVEIMTGVRPDGRAFEDTLLPLEKKAWSAAARAAIRDHIQQTLTSTSIRVADSVVLPAERPEAISDAPGGVIPSDPPPVAEEPPSPPAP